MVYAKKRSGDPDYDDKQPPEFHASGEVVSAGDGVILSRVNGTVDENGAHVSLVTDTETLDNRPAPGEHATSATIVQDYSAEDTPTVGTEVAADSRDIEQIKASQAAVLAVNLDNTGLETVDEDPIPSATKTPAKKSTPSA